MNPADCRVFPCEESRRWPHLGDEVDDRAAADRAGVKHRVNQVHHAVSRLLVLPDQRVTVDRRHLTQ